MVRAKNAYIILRELHQQEKDREVALATENIIDILIKTEDEISLENYKERRKLHGCYYECNVTWRCGGSFGDELAYW